MTSGTSASMRYGRAVLSVRMVLTLWLYAISMGIGSAREIERLTGSDDGFRWIERVPPAFMPPTSTQRGAVARR